MIKHMTLGKPRPNISISAVLSPSQIPSLYSSQPCPTTIFEKNIPLAWPVNLRKVCLNVCLVSNHQQSTRLANNVIELRDSANASSRRCVSRCLARLLGLAHGFMVCQARPASRSRQPFKTASCLEPLAKANLCIWGLDRLGAFISRSKSN